MKTAVIISFIVGILMWSVGCTIDQGEGAFTVEAEVTNIGHTMLSVKYHIGETVLFDDIPMKGQAGILEMIREKGTKTIPLTVHIEFNNSDDSHHNSSSLKYYYGANLLGESHSFDLDSILLMAKKNQEMFKWIYRDGEIIKNEESKTPELKVAPKKGVTTTTTKEIDRKL